MFTTTVTSGSYQGGVAVHSHIEAFEDKNQAEIAAAAVNENKNCGRSRETFRQWATPLFETK